MIDISDWNVRIVQNGEVIEDVLYNIYNDLSLVFDENEELFCELFDTPIFEDAKLKPILVYWQNYHGQCA